PIRSGLLFAELVAGETQNGETFFFVLAVKRLQLAKLGGKTAMARSVDNHDHLSGVFGHRGRPAPDIRRKIVKRLFHLFLTPYDTRVANNDSICIVFLGNPGKEYEKTRHNVGWLCADIVEQNENLAWSAKGDFLFAQRTRVSTKVYYCKPQTFMNLSGE